MTEAPITDARAYILAFMEREFAELEAVEQLPTRGRKRKPGESVVYSMRLDPDEVAALERRAHRMGLKPTVLARNLIRVGLGSPANQFLGDALGQAVDNVEQALEELRALIP